MRQGKTEPLIDEMELLQANPKYACVRYPDGRETTGSIRHLAPTGDKTECEQQNDGPHDSESGTGRISPATNNPSFVPPQVLEQNTEEC